MVFEGSSIESNYRPFSTLGQTGLCKQCKSRSDVMNAADQSTLFATHPAISQSQVVKWTP